MKTATGCRVACVAGVLAAVAGLSVSVLAQVAPPPQPKPAGWPEETPVVQPTPIQHTVSVEEARRRGLLQERETPGAEAPQNVAAQPAPATPAVPAASKPAPAKQTAIDPWPRDGSGRIVHPDRPVEWAALDYNTSISKDSRRKIESVLDGRRARFEQVVYQNVDKVMFLDSGVVESFEMSDREALSKVLEANKAFQGIPSLAAELRKADLFTANSVQMHQGIMESFRKALIADMRRGDEQNKPVENPVAVGRGMFWTIVNEPRQVYYWLLSDSASTAVDIVSSLGLSTENEPKVRAFFEQAKAANEESARVESMRSAFALLTPDQARQVLATVVKPAASAQGAAPASPATSDASKAGEGR